MELLAPAGNLEKLKSAIAYGADAVYFGGKDFSLRARSGNFDDETLDEGIKYLHDAGKKGYLALNIFARNDDISDICHYAEIASLKGVDAFIISDPGVFSAIKSMNLGVPLHISTQANVTNVSAVNFWERMGASRIILARELSSLEIKHICENSDIEIEVFVHGAMCISMSGRCLISNYMTDRDANRGECSQPCRWNYALVEETRPGEYMSIQEDERGTYFYNSKDLNLFDKLGELASFGVHSVKIEGRMKSIAYVSTVTGVYRRGVDSAVSELMNYKADESLSSLLCSVSNRSFTTGHYESFSNGSADTMNYGSSSYVSEADFLGVVRRRGDDVYLECRHAFEDGELLHIIEPSMKETAIHISDLKDAEGRGILRANPNSKYYMTEFSNYADNSLLRRYRTGDVK